MNDVSDFPQCCITCDYHIITCNETLAAYDIQCVDIKCIKDLDTNKVDIIWYSGLDLEMLNSLKSVNFNEICDKYSSIFEGDEV